MCCLCFRDSRPVAGTCQMTFLYNEVEYDSVAIDLVGINLTLINPVSYRYTLRCGNPVKTFVLFFFHCKSCKIIIYFLTYLWSLFVLVARSFLIVFYQKYILLLQSWPYASTDAKRSDSNLPNPAILSFWGTELKILFSWKSIYYRINGFSPKVVENLDKGTSKRAYIFNVRRYCLSKI